MIHLFVTFSQGGRGESVTLPSMGNEHDISVELLLGYLSGGPSSFRLESASGPETRPKKYLQMISLVLNPFDTV